MKFKYLKRFNENFRSEEVGFDFIGSTKEAIRILPYAETTQGDEPILIISKLNSYEQLQEVCNELLEYPTWDKDNFPIDRDTYIWMIDSVDNGNGKWKAYLITIDGGKLMSAIDSKGNNVYSYVNNVINNKNIIFSDKEGDVLYNESIKHDISGLYETLKNSLDKTYNCKLSIKNNVITVTNNEITIKIEDNNDDNDFYIVNISDKKGKDILTSKKSDGNHDSPDQLPTDSILLYISRYFQNK